jgi:hypothetical protein
LRQIRNEELREREKEADQLRCYKLWLADSDRIKFISELKFDDDIPKMSDRQLRKLIEDFAASIVREAIRSKK